MFIHSCYIIVGVFVLGGDVVKIENKQKLFFHYLDDAYNQPIGELCQRIHDSKGEACYSILLSVLCDRVDLNSDNFEKHNVLIKKFKKTRDN